MSKNLPKGACLSVTEAAQALGVSPDTLRRLEKKGKIKPIRDEKNNRVFLPKDLEIIRELINTHVPSESLVTIQQAARIMGLSVDTLRRWEKEGRLESVRTPGGHRRYKLSQVTKPKAFFAKTTPIKEVRYLPIDFPTTQKIDYALDLSSEIPALYRNLDWQQKKVIRFVASSFLTILTIFAATQAAGSKGMEQALSSISNYIPILQRTTTSPLERKLKGQVLQATDVTNAVTFGVNVATIFRDDVNIETNLTVEGDVALNGGNITSTANTFDLLDTEVASLNIGGEATAISLGAATGTTLVNNALTSTGTLTASGDVVIKGVTYIFPTTQGAASTFLKNNGSGTLSWSTITTDLTNATGTLGQGSGGTGSTTFTAGSVIFADGTKLTQDNANFFWDDTNNILSIGSGGAVNPTVNLGADLGSPTLRWNNLYVGNVNSNASLSLTGQALFTYDPADTTYTESSVLINPTAPEANEWMLGIGQGGYQRAGVDAEGDLVLGYDDAVSAPSATNPLEIYNHGATQVASISTSGDLVLAGSATISGAGGTAIDSSGTALFKSQFSYQNAITLTNSGGVLTNYDVLVEVNTATLVGAAKLQSDCDDLRFVSSDGSTPLQFWIEQGCNTATTQVWVRVPSIPNGTSTIYMVYGNSSASQGSIAWGGSFILMSNASCPAGWTTVTALDNKFPRGNTAYGGTGGASTHTHTATGTGTAGTSYGDGLSGSDTWAASGHAHVWNIVGNSADHTPQYVDTVFCKKTAPLELVPTNFILLHTSTLPAGWTADTAYNSKFPRGAAVYGGTGGNTTHANTIANLVSGGASPNSPNIASGGSSTAAENGHTHSYTGGGSMVAANNLPPYIDFIFAAPDTAVKFPDNIVSAFDGVPPLGWTRYTALDSSFPRGNTVAGGSGGAATHTHTFSFTSGGPSAANQINQSGSSSVARGNHTHVVSGTSSEETSIPPYVDMLYYSRNTSSVTAALGTEATNANVGPTEVVYDNATGNLGMGTTTPLWKLQVSDNQGATASAMIENIANLSTAPVGLIIRLGNDATDAGNDDRFINFMKGDSSIIGKIQGNGSGDLLYTTTGTDFAEYFKKANIAEDLSPGDLICISPNSSVTKCDNTNSNILGVVSDKAGFAGGGDHEGDPNFVLVGLVGQLDIKVATESGVIHAGDALTASAIPGVAQKATHEGYIIGKALEDWEEGKQRLLTYISASWFNPKVFLLASGELEIGETDESTNASSSAIANVDPNNPLAVTETLTVQSIDADLIETANLVVNEKQFSTYLTELQSQVESVKIDLSLIKADLWASGLASASGSATPLGTSVFADVVVSGKLNVGGLALDGINNSLDAIGTLKIQSLALGSIEFQNNSIEIDKNGNLNIKNGIIIANANLRNSETLPAGESTLTVARTWEKIPVSITATPNYNTRVWVTERSENGFTINVETPPSEDATIDWIAIW